MSKKELNIHVRNVIDVKFTVNLENELADKLLGLKSHDKELQDIVNDMIGNVTVEDNKMSLKETVRCHVTENKNDIVE